MMIGYIDLGNMGGVLASRLALKYPLHVHDQNPSATQRIRGPNLTPCANPSELAASCETIFLCLPTTDQVRDVLFGANGIAATVRPGSMIVDQTKNNVHP